MQHVRTRGTESLRLANGYPFSLRTRSHATNYPLRSRNRNESVQRLIMLSTRHRIFIGNNNPFEIDVRMQKIINDFDDISKFYNLNFLENFVSIFCYIRFIKFKFEQLYQICNVFDSVCKFVCYINNRIYKESEGNWKCNFI